MARWIVTSDDNGKPCVKHEDDMRRESEARDYDREWEKYLNDFFGGDYDDN